MKNFFREITPTFFWVKILVVICTPFGFPPNVVQHGPKFLSWFTSFWIWCLGSLLNNCESLVHRLFPKMYKNLVQILFASCYQIAKFSMSSNIAYFGKIVYSWYTRCRNIRNFVSLRFYVKSFLEDLEVPKIAILGAMKFVNLVYFRLQKVQKFIKLKIQSLWMC